MPRRRRSLPGLAAGLLLNAGAVVTQRIALAMRGALAPGEAARMVAEKPAAFALATAAAMTAMLRHPLAPLAAFGAGARAWTRTVGAKARANRKRLARRR